MKIMHGQNRNLSAKDPVISNGLGNAMDDVIRSTNWNYEIARTHVSIKYSIVGVMGCVVVLLYCSPPSWEGGRGGEQWRRTTHHPSNVLLSRVSLSCFSLVFRSKKKSECPG